MYLEEIYTTGSEFGNERINQINGIMKQDK